MADFTILDSDALDHGGTLSQATSASFTPAVGDVIGWGGNNSVGTNAAVSGGGMTWTQRGTIESGGVGAFLVIFEATSGTPSAGVLTLTADDNWVDTTYAIIRPVDLTFDQVAGQDNSGGATADSLTIALTTTSPDALLAFGRDSQNVGWVADSGWTKLAITENVAGGRSQTVQERFSDDAEWIADPDAGTGSVEGVVLEYTAAGGGASGVAGERGANRGAYRGAARGTYHAAMTKLNGLWRPKDTQRIIPVMGLQGV